MKKEKNKMHDDLTDRVNRLVRNILKEAINEIGDDEISRDPDLAYDEGVRAGKILFARQLMLDLYEIKE
jgi:hypothetical protein